MSVKPDKLWKANSALGRLSSVDLKLLNGHLFEQVMPKGLILAEPEDELSHVHFPLEGMLSLLTVMHDGRAIEIGTIGPDGFFGGSAALVSRPCRVRAMVQVQMRAATITAATFRKAVAMSTALQALCVDAQEAQLAQARITAACNALHPTGARFCRWILQTSDVTRSSDVEITQDLLAMMLGVRRTSITEVAQKFQRDGAIRYSHGTIRIADRSLLEEHACECLQMLRDQRAL